MWSAGISEVPLPGSMVGPTFACIIGKQFHNFRFGDRFWYENGGWPSSFTLEQLNEIRKVKLSRLICDNGDDVDSMQVSESLCIISNSHVSMDQVRLTLSDTY